MITAAAPARTESPRSLTPRYRPFLWAGLATATAALLSFPTHFALEYHPVQSIHVFDNLPLFGALYYLWTTLLLSVLLTTREEHRAVREGVAIAALFTLVFVGFWSLVGGGTVPGRDTPVQAASVRHIVEAGHVTDDLANPNLYLNFPGLPLILTTTIRVTGLSIHTVITLVTIMANALFAALLYLLAIGLLGSVYRAGLAAILIVLSSPYSGLMSDLYPGSFSLVLLTLLLCLTHKLEGEGRQRSTNTFLFLLGIGILALAMTHMVTSFVFVAVVAAFSVLKWLRHHGKGRGAGFSVLLIAVVIVLSWQLFYSTAILKNSTILVRNSLTSIDRFIEYIGTIFETQLGARVPGWATYTQYFWLLTVFALGTLLGLTNVARVRTLHPNDVLPTAGVVGTISLTWAVTLGTAVKGGAEYYRFLMYAGIFTVPLIISLFSGSTPTPGAGFTINRRGGTLGSILLVVAVGILSLPSFLSYNKIAAFARVYPFELSAGEFLEASYGDKEGVTLYSDIASALAIAIYSAPKATFVFEGEAVESKSSAQLWKKVEALLDSFESRGITEGPSVFLLCLPRMQGTYAYFWQIDAYDPHWEMVGRRMSQQSLIYSNGDTQVYAPSR
ncbi:MAG: hypothetical protein QN141_11315 [Armatimonadota bacterium]|nr:hypothetical protein [Armatimonadota bacterium]